MRSQITRNVSRHAVPNSDLSPIRKASRTPTNDPMQYHEGCNCGAIKMQKLHHWNCTVFNVHRLQTGSTLLMFASTWKDYLDKNYVIMYICAHAHSSYEPLVSWHANQPAAQFIRSFKNLSLSRFSWAVGAPPTDICNYTFIRDSTKTILRVILYSLALVTFWFSQVMFAHSVARL